MALAFGRAGFGPNALTLSGFALTAAAAVAVGFGDWVLAAGLLCGGGAFDLLDGALARSSGRATRFGALLDSASDRLGEGVVYVGIVAATAGLDGRLATLAAVALVAAFLVSYLRARAEGLDYRGDVGLAGRAERLVILVAGLAGTAAGGGIGPGRAGSAILGLTLAVIAALCVITAMQRIRYVRAQDRLAGTISDQGAREPERRETPGRRAS